jgi:hypothetical protein
LVPRPRPGRIPIGFEMAACPGARVPGYRAASLRDADCLGSRFVLPEFGKIAIGVGAVGIGIGTREEAAISVGVESVPRR